MAATRSPDPSDDGPRNYRSGTPIRLRPIPAHLPRKAIESSDVLKHLASREPLRTEDWSRFWERRFLR